MNNFVIPNDIEDGLVREGWQDENERYHNKITNAANHEPIQRSDEPGGFASKQACIANALLVVGIAAYARLEKALREIEVLDLTDGIGEAIEQDIESVFEIVDAALNPTTQEE